jgi:hypothetical protein
MNIHLKHEAFRTYEKTIERPGSVKFNTNEEVQALRARCRGRRSATKTQPLGVE